MPEIGAGMARVPAWVAAAADDQVAAYGAIGVRLGRGENGRDDAVFRAEPVKRERARIKLAVRRRTHQPVSVVFKNDFSRIERDNFDAPQCAAETRLGNMRLNLAGQLGNRSSAVGVKRVRRIRREANDHQKIDSQFDFYIYHGRIRLFRQDRRRPLTARYWKHTANFATPKTSPPARL